MANWQAYGKWLKVSAAVGITSGAIITGVFIRAKHLAEPLAAAIERDRLWDLRGTDQPSTNDVYMNSFTIFKKLYDETMVVGRNLATNENAYNIFWLAQPITNGMDVAGADVDWYVLQTNFLSANHLVEIVWQCTTPSNITEQANTTASIMEDDRYAYTPFIAKPRLPLASEIFDEFGTINSIATNSIFGGTNNWWTYIGMGTNVYKYSLESYFYDYFIATIIKYESSSRIDKDSLSFTFDNWDTTQVVTVAALSTGEAVAYKIPDPSGLSNGVFGVVNDATDGFGNENGIRVQDGAAYTKMFVVQDGNTNINISFRNIYSTNPARADKTVTFSYVGDVSGTNHIDLNAAVDTQYVDFYVPEGGAGIINLVTTPTASYYPPFSMSIINEHPAPYYTISPLSKFDPPLVAASTTEVSVVLSAQPEELQADLATSRFIRTNNLHEAMNVISNLDDTVCILEELYPTSVVWNTYYYVTNFPSLSSADAGYPYTAQDVIDYHNLSFASGPSSVTSNHAANTYLMDAFVDGETEYIKSATSTNSTASSSIDITFYDWIACRPEYPSLYAITNGYVNKFSVYGIFEADNGSRFSLPERTWATNVIDYTTDTTQPDKYENYLFGVVDNVRHLPDGPPFADEFQYNNFSTNSRSISSSVQYIDAPVVLLAEVDCSDPPTSYPYFDIIPDRTNLLNFVQADYQYRMQHYTGYDGTPFESVYESVEFNTYILRFKFLIVVDWNWKHLNPGNPFTP